MCIRDRIYEAIKETTGTWDATAWEETTLAKVNGKLNGDIISLSEKFVDVSYIDDSMTVNAKTTASPRSIKLSNIPSGYSLSDVLVSLENNSLSWYVTVNITRLSGQTIIYTVKNESSTNYTLLPKITLQCKKY